MAIEWYDIDNNVSLGIDWCAVDNGNSISLSPKVYRWDRYETDNYGGRFSEYLSPDPSGAGEWHNLTWGSGYGTRELHQFNKRIYNITSSAQTVSLTLEWDSLFGTSTSYDGGVNNYFYTIGSGSHTWTYTVKQTRYCAISYNANGGSGAPANQTHLYNTTSKISGVKPIRNGYVFLGWSLSSSSTSATWISNGRYINNNFTSGSTITLYAVWKKVDNYWVNVPNDVAVKDIHVKVPDGKSLANVYFKV